jgi:hypothetical protein
MTLPALVVIGLGAFALTCDALGDLVLIWRQQARRRTKDGAQ